MSEAHIRGQREHGWRRRGIDLAYDEYEGMLTDQEEKCAICKVDFDATPHVDHNHETGRVRGLLCGPCNILLGHSGDDINRLIHAGIYLEEAQAAERQ